MLFKVDYTSKSGEVVEENSKWVNFAADAVEATRRFMDWFFSSHPGQEVRVNRLTEVEIIGDLSGVDFIDEATQPASGEDQPNGVSLIATERARQIAVEGWTLEHDDRHRQAELTNAAAAYAEAAAMQIYGEVGQEDIDLCGDSWPWARDYWKPSPNPIRNLVKAGALIAAEIDRLQRARIT